MKTMSVDDGLFSALEAAAELSGRTVQELVNEALVSWLADAAMDDAEYTAIKKARAEAVEQGGVEFERFFNELLEERT